MIQLEHIFYSYDGRPVLQDLNLTLSPGERVAVVGPSGGGKTTLLHLLAGLLTPQKGKIIGLPTEGASAVFQEDRLLPQLTVVDNLALVAKTTPVQKLYQLLEEAGLGEEIHQLPGQLSGGQARRVAILRGLVCRRPLLLLDEPLQGLDIETKGQMIALLNREMEGRTVVLITHDPQEARLLGCTIYSLEELQTL